MFDTEAVRRIYSVSCVFGLVTEFVECLLSFTSFLHSMALRQQRAWQSSGFGIATMTVTVAVSQLLSSQVLAFRFFLPRYVNICSPDTVSQLVVVAMEWRGRG